MTLINSMSTMLSTVLYDESEPDLLPDSIDVKSENVTQKFKLDTGTYQYFTSLLDKLLGIQKSA